MATVALEKLVKRYGVVEAVRSIDLDIADREFVALVGPSGCGKSTTLRMIAGLEEITSGNIRIGGEIVNDLPPRARNISMVFQSYALYPHMSVRENMAFSLKIAKRPQDEIDRARQRRRARSCISTNCSTAGPRSSPAASASASRWGARSCASPRCSCSTSRSPISTPSCAPQMRAEIKRLHARVPSTVVYVTHDQVEAMTLADRIVIMRDGLIEQVGTPERGVSSPGDALRRRLHRLAGHEHCRGRDRRPTGSCSQAATGCRCLSASATPRSRSAA